MHRVSTVPYSDQASSSGDILNVMRCRRWSECGLVCVCSVCVCVCMLASKSLNICDVVVWSELQYSRRLPTILHASTELRHLETTGEYGTKNVQNKMSYGWLNNTINLPWASVAPLLCKRSADQGRTRDGISLHKSAIFQDGGRQTDVAVLQCFMQSSELNTQQNDMQAVGSLKNNLQTSKMTAGNRK